MILQAGLDEITDHGLNGARIERIARTAGVTRPTVYAHFPRKEDFLLELRNDFRDRVLEDLKPRIGDARGAEVVHRLIDALYDQIEHVHPVLRRESLSVVIREPDEMDWAGDPLFEMLVSRFFESDEGGERASTLSAEELGRLLVPAFLGVLIFENVPLDARRQAAHQTLELLMRGSR